MRVLVTGATGFLGRYVVAEAVRRGHEVTALVRPSRKLADDYFPVDVKIARGDVRIARGLAEAMADIDAVIHLAACVVGDDDAQFASTVVGTENLLAAMAQQQVTHMIHCSSFSVYDWQQPSRQLDEQSPLEANLYQRDGYAVSKTWQERLVRREAEANDWHLTILRPGFIWGASNALIAGIGQSMGRWHFVIGPGRALPITYVENCAECFITALENPSKGEIYNVIDDQAISAWQYMGACIESGTTTGRRVYVPYWLGITAAKLASWTSRLLFGPTAKLPGLFVPIKFRARFRPLRFPNSKLHDQLRWQPRYSFQAAWQRIRTGEASASLTPEPVQQTAPQREDTLV